MTLEELIRPEGHDCACGHHHGCGLRYFRAVPGAVRFLPEALDQLGVKKPFVVMDQNTRRAAGQQVEAVLSGRDYVLYVFPGEEHIESDEYAVGSLMMAFEPDCDGVLAVGSGVINDCCKEIAHAMGKPSLVVCTAPSMDGYASGLSSMVRRRIKVSLYNACPKAIIADTDILATAPDHMLRAGLGDMLAKYVALGEWRIAHLVHGDDYCEEIAELMRTSLKKIVAGADGLMQRDPAALAAVTEGLVISGLAMAFAGNSRPASGLEHYFSHMWEMKALRGEAPVELHGIQCGVGTLLTLKLLEAVFPDQPDMDRARQAVQTFSPEAWQQQVERLFGSIAPDIIRIEEQFGKNDPDKHAGRLQLIAEHWPEIRQIVQAELPDSEMVRSLMARCGLPLSPQDIGLTAEDTVDAFLGSRDIRDKYLTSSLLWDLGLMEEAVKALRNMAN